MSIELSDLTLRQDGAPGLILAGKGNTASVAQENGVSEDVIARGIEERGGGWEIAYLSDKWKVRDRIIPVTGNVARLERSWEFLGSGTFTGRLLIELATAFDPEFYLIPDVSYNGNLRGSGGEPRGISRGGKDWLYYYERTSLPSATFSERRGLCAGLFASPESLRCSCGFSAAGSRLVHRLVYPGAEEPLTYADTDAYESGWEKTLTLERNQSFSTGCYLYLNASAAFRTGWFEAFRFFFERFVRIPENRYSTGELWALGLEYLRSCLWVDDGKFTGFSIGLLPDGVHSKAAPGKQWKQRLRGRYEIGWAGQNFANAWILMQDYISNGRRASLDDAVRMFDLWEKNARVENGLFHAMYDGLIGGRVEGSVDTCNLGWGALMAMEGYETAGSLGLDKPRWLDMGLRCCDFFAEAWKRFGTFGKLWALDGFRCLDETGTVGAFMLMPMLKAYRLTENKIYLDTAEAAFRFYKERDLDDMACCAGALDTDCIDCETAHSLLYSAIRLYEITGRSAYLDSAVKAAEYIATWVYLYDVIPEPASDFAKLGVRTAGLGAVSAQHHHLHCGPLYFVKDWLKLAEYTGDDIWARYARLAWAGSQQAISDGTLALHGMTRPRGSENEAYHQCRWGLGDNGGARHYVNDWLVIWPITFRLLNLTGPERDKIAAALDAWDPITKGAQP
jgi:hypothetical protein